MGKLNPVKSVALEMKDQKSRGKTGLIKVEVMAFWNLGALLPKSETLSLFILLPCQNFTYITHMTTLCVILVAALSQLG